MGYGRIVALASRPEWFLHEPSARQDAALEGNATMGRIVALASRPEWFLCEPSARQDAALEGSATMGLAYGRLKQYFGIVNSHTF
jgi:hypothetical protein